VSGRKKHYVTPYSCHSSSTEILKEILRLSKYSHLPVFLLVGKLLALAIGQSKLWSREGQSTLPRDSSKPRNPFIEEAISNK
jgi:hypothetical protein